MVQAVRYITGLAQTRRAPRMFDNFTDVELQEFLGFPKRVCNPRARGSGKPAVHPLHRQCTFRATATTNDNRTHRLLVFQRENLRDKENFSCGIVYLPPSGQRLTLARYNGSANRHGDIQYKPHIHRATEAAIEAGRKPEHTAEETDCYTTIIGALACLVKDFSLSGMPTQHFQRRLFDGHQR